MNRADRVHLAVEHADRVSKNVDVGRRDPAYYDAEERHGDNVGR